MSASLVEQFSGDFDPEQFTDKYQAQLRELLDAKLEQGESVDTEATFGKESSEEDSSEGGKVISLMDALERSVRKRRGAQESEGSEASDSREHQHEEDRDAAGEEDRTEEVRGGEVRRKEDGVEEGGVEEGRGEEDRWQELGREEVRLSTRDQHMVSPETP